MQVNVLEGLHHYNVAAVAADSAAGGPQEGLFEGAGAGVKNGEVDAGIVGVDGDVFGAGGGAVQAVCEFHAPGAVFTGAAFTGVVFFEAHMVVSSPYTQ